MRLALSVQQRDPARRAAAAGVILFAIAACGWLATGARAQEGAPATPEWNTICPVMTDQEIDPEIWVEHEGRRVYLCCQKCRRLWVADPAKYAPNLTLVAGGGAPESGLEARSPLPPKPPTLAERIGRWHVAALHFPIALLGAAALVEVMRPRGSLGGLGAVRVMLGLGAAGSVVAAGLGLLLEESVEGRYAALPAEAELLDWHKWAGIASAALAVAADLLVERRARLPERTPGWLSTGAVILAATAVGLAGHFGGQMVWGRDFLFAW